jgi:hypothetical protein
MSFRQDCGKIFHSAASDVNVFRPKAEIARSTGLTRHLSVSDDPGCLGSLGPKVEAAMRGV